MPSMEMFHTHARARARTYTHTGFPFSVSLRIANWIPFIDMETEIYLREIRGQIYTRRRRKK